MKTFTEYPAERVQSARESVANWWADNARAIRQSDCYASHVTEETKDEMLTRGLETAERVRRGEMDCNFTIWQRINTELTGECVALLT